MLYVIILLAIILATCLTCIFRSESQKMDQLVLTPEEERMSLSEATLAYEQSYFARCPPAGDVEAWNRDKVGGLTDSTPSQLVDAFLKGRNETIEVLAAYDRSALDGSVTVAGGESVPLLDFIDRVSNHTSWHAAQLVPASSRARLGGDR